MTGEVVNREPELSNALSDPDEFDFTAAMRETRIKAEELLTDGRIEEAEAYMEDRRQFLEENGYFIRKINQAFFAFHGSYATGAGSVSPIGDQLEELSADADSLEDFLKTVSEFKRVSDLVDYLGVGLPSS